MFSDSIKRKSLLDGVENFENEMVKYLKSHFKDTDSFAQNLLLNYAQLNLSIEEIENLKNNYDYIEDIIDNEQVEKIVIEHLLSMSEARVRYQANHVRGKETKDIRQIFLNDISRLTSLQKKLIRFGFIEDAMYLRPLIDKFKNCDKYDIEYPLTQKQYKKAIKEYMLSDLINVNASEKNAIEITCRIYDELL